VVAAGRCVVRVTAGSGCEDADDMAGVATGAGAAVVVVDVIRRRAPSLGVVADGVGWTSLDEGNDDDDDGGGELVVRGRVEVGEDDEEDDEGVEVQSSYMDLLVQREMGIIMTLKFSESEWVC
jgi:hypothetical protein